MGSHRLHVTTPKRHRASRLIPQSTLPSRDFCSFVAAVLLTIGVSATVFGAVHTVPVDAQTAVVTADAPHVVPVALRCSR